MPIKHIRAHVRRSPQGMLTVSSPYSAIYKAITAEYLGKAEQHALFDAPVIVGGYTTKTGQFIAPHAARRRKRIDTPPPKTGDLFQPAAAKPLQMSLFMGKPQQPSTAAAGPPPVERHRYLTKDELRASAPAAGVLPDPPTTAKARRAINAKCLALLADGKDREPNNLSTDQRNTLARYSGNGGIGDSLNEYYTRADVCSAMWTTLGQLGIASGASVLEPSSGVGMFLRTAPPGIRCQAVEYDQTSARIGAALHPEHQHFQGPFESFATQDVRLFDAVIGNPPFGPRGATLALDKPDRARAEEYFLEAALDKTKDGGIVAMVVPTGVLDRSGSADFREGILCRAEFLGAHRMPASAFEHSQTGVVTDVLFFRKRESVVAQALLAASNGAIRSGPGKHCKTLMESLGIDDTDFVNGRCFQNSDPRCSLHGTLEEGWRAKAGMGNDITVAGSMDGVADAIAATPMAAGDKTTLSEVMAAAAGDKVAATEQDLARLARAARKTPYEVAEKGDIKVVDGVTYLLDGDPPRWHRTGEIDTEPGKVQQARQIGAELRALAVAPTESGRAAIATALDAYISEHGSPAEDRDLQRRAKGDRDLLRMLAAVKNDGGYSDLITGGADQSDNSIHVKADAASILRGGFTASELAADSGADQEAIADMLWSGRRYALLPDAGDTERWQSMGSYLTGDLWPKYDAVRAALSAESVPEATRARFEAQAKALEATIGPKLLDDVDFQIDSGFIPVDVLQGFFRARQQQQESGWPSSSKADPVKISYENNVYLISGGGYETGMVGHYLNRTRRAKEDREKLEALNEDFRTWVMGSDQRGRVEELYNRAFQGYVSEAESKAPIEIPGLNPDFNVNDYHWAGLRWAMKAGSGIIAADVGLGKAQPLDAKVLTPSGWTTMAEIKVGDQVIAGDGAATTVLGVYPQGLREIFEVEFSDGAKAQCCDEHLWQTQTEPDRKKERYHRHLGEFRLFAGAVRPLSEIRETLVYQTQKNHKIPMVAPIEHPHAKLPIDPYVLGVLIGDGSFKKHHVSFCKPDVEIAESVAALVSEDFGGAIVVSRQATTTRAATFGLARNAVGPNPALNAIRALGLSECRSHEKFVPTLYLFGSPAQRIAMLRGLMDTDGYVSKDGVTVQFTSTSAQLAQDVRHLVQSLGGIAWITTKTPTYTYKGACHTGRLAYTVGLRMPPDINPFLLERKASRVRPRSKYLPVRYITAVRSIGVKSAQCIRIEHPSHLYVTDDFVVTHNTGRALMLAKLAKATGRAKKPLIVAPKSVLASWAASAEEWFPGSKVLVIGETYSLDKKGNKTTKADDAATRTRKLHDLAQNDYDFAIISAPAWDSLRLSDSTVDRYTDSDFWETRARALEGAKQKKARKLKENFDQQAAQRSFRADGDAIDFEDLGVDMLVVDEAHHCFPAGTLIDGRPIEDLAAGDLVTAFDHGNGMVAENSTILNVQKRRPSDLYRLTLDDGTVIVCTGDHPIFTEHGYMFAKNVLVGDSLYKNVYKKADGHDKKTWRPLEDRGSKTGDGELELQPLQPLHDPKQNSGLEPTTGAQPVLLQSLLCDEVQAGEAGPRSYLQGGFGTGRHALPTGREKTEGRAWGLAEHSRSEGEITGEGSGECLPAVDTGRERQAPAVTASCTAELAGERMAGRACGEDGEDSDGGLSAPLQGGHRAPETDDCHRGGRRVAQLSHPAGPRPEETGTLERVGVASVEVLEPTSDGTFGGLCPDGFVYNIEVADHSNYFAGGVLVHNCKNLFALRSRFGDTPRFLGGSGESKTALDTMHKAKFVREKAGGNGVFMLTATPTKNSPLEVYSMLQHVAPEVFTKVGIRNSEEFIDRFCEFKDDLILGVNGQFEQALCTDGFKNLDELREIMKRHIDRTTADDVGLKLPSRDDRTHFVEMSSQQHAVYDQLRAQAEGKTEGMDEADAHIFSIMTRMGKASLDLELLDPKAYAGAESPKYRAVAANVAEMAAEGGQVVFCDTIGAHEKLKQALVAKGMNPAEIAIINAQTAPKSGDRLAIADAFNAGKLKVVIGNTATMGEGINLQKKTTDIHHMDLPWEPASMQQRNGRGLRQGNINEAVRIHHYLAKGSFDGYRQQTLAAKKNWMDQLWSGGAKVENLGREGKISRDDMLVMLAADPAEAEKRMAESRDAARKALAAARRRSVGDTFSAYRVAKRNHAALGNKASTTAIKLAQRIESQRQALQRASKEGLVPESAIADPEAHLHLPASGHFAAPGDAFTVSIKDKTPINWADGRHSFVVESIDAANATLNLRQVGTNARAKVETKSLPQSVESVTFDAIDDSAKRQRHAVGVGAGEIGLMLTRMGYSAEHAAAMSDAAAAAASAQVAAMDTENPDWHTHAAGRAQLHSAVHHAVSDAILGISRANGELRAVRNYDNSATAAARATVDRLVAVSTLYANGLMPYKTAGQHTWGVVGLEDRFAKLPSALLEEHGELLRKVWRDAELTDSYAAQGGADGSPMKNVDRPYGSAVPMAHRESGVISLVPKADTKGKLGDHDILLPTDANIEKLANAAAQEHLAARIKPLESHASGRSRNWSGGDKPGFGREYGRAYPTGFAPLAPQLSRDGNSYTNLSPEYRKRVQALATRKVNAAVLENIASAAQRQSFNGAVYAAVPAMESGYGTVRASAPAEVVRALATAAANLGVLHQRMPSHPGLPPLMFGPDRYSSATVRQVLGHMLPDDDAFWASIETKNREPA